MSMPESDSRTSVEPESKDASEETPALTRRQFVGSAAGAAAVTAAGGFATTATAADTAESLESLPMDGEPADGEPPYGAARISREGQRLLAEHEYEQQKKGNAISYDKKLNAVEDLGCDPTGNEPAQDKIMDAAEDGVLVVFPPGIYLITGEISIGLDGTFGIVGQGFRKSKKPPKPGKNSTVFKVESSEPMRAMNFSPLAAGEIGNFVLDRKDSVQSGMQVRSGANVRVRDIRVIGAQTYVGNPDTIIGGTLAAETPGENALLVVERFVTRGGGIPGTKNIGGSPAFAVFGRSNSNGTIFLRDCVGENSPDNGIYGARTDANLYIHGGMYRNNDVNQIRVNGDARVDGVDVIIDEKHYTGLKSKSYARERGAGWPAANGIKVETEPRIGVSTGTPIRNCNIVGASVADVSRVGALIYVWGSGGAVMTENTRITNNIKGSYSVLAQRPGSGDDPAAPKPWRFLLKNSVVQGKGAGEGGPAVSIRGRPRSLVTGTCFQYPGASSSDIEGAAVSNCGFGKQCKSAGLKAPKKVGSGGDLTIPVNVSYPDGGGGGGGLLGWAGKLLAGMVALPLIAVAITVLPIIIGLLVIGGVTFGGLFLFFKKLSG